MIPDWVAPDEYPGERPDFQLVGHGRSASAGRAGIWKSGRWWIALWQWRGRRGRPWPALGSGHRGEGPRAQVFVDATPLSGRGMSVFASSDESGTVPTSWGASRGALDGGTANGPWPRGAIHGVRRVCASCLWVENCGTRGAGGRFYPFQEDGWFSSYHEGSSSWLECVGLPTLL